jgi:hypothetical protein
MKYYCCCCCQFNDIKHEERHRLRINPSTVIRYLREMWKNLRPHGHRQMGLAQRDRGAGHYLTAPITLRAHTNSLEADSQCWTKSCVNLIRIQILLSFLSIKSKRCCRLSSNFVVDVADQKWEPCMKPNQGGFRYFGIDTLTILLAFPAYRLNPLLAYRLDPFPA